MKRAPAEITVVGESEPRRLAAFVHADMVGYSALIAYDDAGTFARFARLRRLLIDPSVTRFEGKIVNTSGDSFLIEFSSVISAVRFAVEVQVHIPDFDGDTPPSQCIRFRMGVNAGDAISDGDNRHGDSVNIAVRLQTACPTGGVCVTALVRDHVQAPLGLRFESLGKLNLKNIPRPIEAFVVRFDGSVATGAWKLNRFWTAGLPVSVGLVVALTLGMSKLPNYRPVPADAHAASIMVMPFRNGSDDSTQQYLADAVTTDVTTDLSRMRDVVVISPATAFAYKGEVDPKQINQEIGVRYLLVGRIRRIGQQINTNIQLIDAASGVQLWGDRFDSDFVDLLKLEDGVTGRIAASLNVQLVQAEGRRAERAVAPDALDLRLRATSLFFRSVTPANTMAARSLLTQAVRLDPGSAETWARLAEITASDYLVHWNNTGREQLNGAEESVRKALLLDPDLALAHVAGGFIHHAHGEHDLAAQAFARAIDLDPNFALAYAHEADELILLGRPSEAAPLVERAIRLSPRDPSNGIFYWTLGRADFCMERYDQAISWLDKSVEVRPNLWFNRLYLASAYALKGDTVAARRTVEEFGLQYASNYTLATVIGLEAVNPVSEPNAVAARARFHRGLLLAGMAES